MAGNYAAAKLRETLGRPVVDADGHVLEYRPALDHYMQREGLGGTEDTFLPAWPADMAERHSAYMSPLTLPAENTLDLATASFPRLLYHRLDEIGIDFAIIFPTLGQNISTHPVSDIRRAACRAENNYMMDIFGEFSDRLAPVAAVPMGTPEEAVEELDFAVGRGFKAIMIPANVQRPTPGVPDDLLRETGWIDSYGIDSAHDYDPFWQRCVDHGVSPSVHTIGMGWGSRRSPSNYVYNQIGHFAATGEAFVKSLLLGGVPHRFPSLRFGILESGAGWAASLYADLVNRWEKRNRDVLPRYYRGRIDGPLFDRLLGEYAPEFVRFGNMAEGSGRTLTQFDGKEDDFARSGVTCIEDIRELFTERFYFGCEADDPSTKIAFDRTFNPMGAEIKALFSSDIGHWDVPDMRGVLHEAHELVERGWIDEGQFHDFTFRNAVRFHGSGNPRFFEGTLVADAARDVLQAPVATA